MPGEQLFTQLRDGKFLPGLQSIAGDDAQQPLCIPLPRQFDCGLIPGRCIVRRDKQRATPIDWGELKLFR
jgi:hypothetical protein